MNKQIEMDLDRTFQTNRYFRDPASRGMVKLRHILYAFNLHSPRVGYCQVSPAQ